MKQTTFKQIGNTKNLSSVMSMCKVLVTQGLKVSISYVEKAGVTITKDLPDEWKYNWYFERIDNPPQFKDKRVRVPQPEDFMETNIGKIKKFRVYEGNKIILETNDKQEAIRTMYSAHYIVNNKIHEIHEWWDGKYNGISQLKPTDKVVLQEDKTFKVIWGERE